MPIYEFKCNHCGQQYEEQKKVDDFKSDCPVCKKPSEKIMSSSSINVKGSPNKTIDSVVGEQAEKRWQEIEENKNKRNKENYGNVSDKEAKEKDGKRIAKLVDRQQGAYTKIEQAKKDAGITKRDELNHALGGNDA